MADTLVKEEERILPQNPTTNLDTREILTLAVEIGDAMLRNGGEIYRVEDTCMKILAAFEVESYDVYVLSNGIFASANEGKEDACSIVRHVPLGAMNLTKISALNQLARDICNMDCSVIDAWERLEECKKLPRASKRLLVLACALGSGGFSILFGGRLMDGVIATLIGVLLQLLLFGFEKYKVARFAKLLLSSMFVTALSLIPVLMGLPVMQDKIVIGTIMPLVPGMAFTTSIRDIYNGDYLSGVIHLIDALLTAICIAVGVGLMISIYRSTGGNI